jgi:hypothetical protein
LMDPAFLRVLTDDGLGADRLHPPAEAAARRPGWLESLAERWPRLLASGGLARRRDSAQARSSAGARS